jgi:hypothetical protein
MDQALRVDLIMIIRTNLRRRTFRVVDQKTNRLSENQVAMPTSSNRAKNRTPLSNVIAEKRPQTTLIILAQKTQELLQQRQEYQQFQGSPNKPLLGILSDKERHESKGDTSGRLRRQH